MPVGGSVKHRFTSCQKDLVSREGGDRASYKVLAFALPVQKSEQPFQAVDSLHYERV